jgi:hypothetical protein
MSAYAAGLQNLPYVPAAASPSAALISGFRATVPPSPAHAASTTVLTAGGHQELVLPLSEAAPELFGGNPAAATPHYDAIGQGGIAGGPDAAVRPIIGGIQAGTPSLGQAGSTGFRATVPPSPAHAASTAILGSGSHQEMVLPLSEAAPELFGGNPAASTPHYDAVSAAGTIAAPAAMNAAAPLFVGPGTSLSAATPMSSNFAATVTPTNYDAARPAVAPSPGAGLSGFRATVPPSPAHGASTTMLGSGSHQEMVLPLSEAAPELFGGNPAASTPHYDAVGAAGVAAAAAPVGAAPFVAAAPVSTVTPMNYAAPAPISTVTPMNYAQSATPSYGTMGAVPPSPSGGIRATVAPSPAHAASTAMLGSGSHQEMVLPLSEAAPELFGGNPAASTPHYDAVGDAGIAAAAAPVSVASAPLPFVAAAPVTATPMNYNAAGAAPLAAAAGIGHGIHATVPPSPAHAASDAMLGSGSHQEMVLPLSEAAPELFGGNPAASTPHYDAM